MRSSSRRPMMTLMVMMMTMATGVRGVRVGKRERESEGRRKCQRGAYDTETVKAERKRYSLLCMREGESLFASTAAGEERPTGERERERESPVAWENSLDKGKREEKREEVE